MTTEVQMPQMGESVAEGTLVRWFKSVGDFVDRDEVLFEISTDKVDTEVPSPASGYLNAILVQEGETVPVDTVVCVLSPEKGAQADLSSGAATSGKQGKGRKQRVGTSSAAGSNGEGQAAKSGSATTVSTAARLRTKSSPLVRRLAAEHGIDLSEVEGTGRDGRVTKDDIMEFVEARAGGVHGTPSATTDTTMDTARPAGDDRIEPLPPMRRKIAEHMVLSRRTSAHVTSVFEVDMTEVHRRKEDLAKKFQKQGTKLTYLAFILEAVCKALKSFPVVNASLEGHQVRYHSRVNLGVAVALEHGLIVPVVRDADTLSLLELSSSVQDLATRARSKKLNPEEVCDGTFTITNPGVFGALIGTPIIHQPQVAILCVGKVEKRPVVLPGTDTVAARSMVYLSLSYDHRLIDGATADQFLANIKESLESGQRSDPLEST